MWRNWGYRSGGIARTIFPANVKVEMFSENLRDVSCCLLSAILLEPSVEHAHLRFDYEFVLF